MDSAEHRGNFAGASNFYLYQHVPQQEKTTKQLHTGTVQGNNICHSEHMMAKIDNITLVKIYFNAKYLT